VKTLILLGPGGWRNRASSLTANATLLALAIATGLALGGCASKKAKPAGAENVPGAGTLGQKGLGGGSLAELQQGTVGREGGPLTDIHFDYNDFTIRAQDGEILRTNASWLNQHSQSRVQVEGHCDERGSEEYNIALGAKRAQAAKDYLVTLGIADSRISTISYGKEIPLCHEHNEECWQKNRRGHFVVSE
jgi:peptidoglycan-associated lipoprotein